MTRTSFLGRINEVMRTALGAGRRSEAKSCTLLSHAKGAEETEGRPFLVLTGDLDASQSGLKLANWVQMNGDLTVPCCGSCIVVSAAGCQSGDSVVRRLADCGFELDILDDMEAAVGSLLARRNLKKRGWTLAVFDLDFLQQFLPLSEILDDLRLLREEVADIPVVLLSREFQRDEFDTHRLTIADASLHSPVSEDRLRKAIWRARQNNLCWRRRQIVRARSMF